MLYESNNILKEINNVNTRTNESDTDDDNGNESYDENFIMNDNTFAIPSKKAVTTASSLKSVTNTINEVQHEVISDKRDTMKQNNKTKLYKNNNILKEANIYNNINTITNKNYTNDDDGNEYDNGNFDMNDRNPEIFSKYIDEENETMRDHFEKEFGEENEMEEEEEEEEKKRMSR
ncbi:hypothetical protein PV325_004565 [Microctonus aethiopoides]|nr:hypothetical protein PV325_004565 [Microctonus aethiopoides]